MQQPFTPADDQNCGAGGGSSFGFASLATFPSLEDKAADMASVACGLAAKACDADAVNDHGLSKQLSDLSKRFIARSNSYLDDADAERKADEANQKAQPLTGGGAGFDFNQAEASCSDVVYFHRVDVLAAPKPGEIDLFAALRDRPDLAHRITDLRFFITDGLTTTVCLLTLDGDLSVVGVGSLVNADHYDRRMGMVCAINDALLKLSDAEGYANKRTILSNAR